MSSRRTERLNEQLKREITTLIRERLRDPRIVGASVTMLGTTSFTMNRTFGWVMATGLVLALLADLTLLPAVLRGSRRRALR